MKLIFAYLSSNIINKFKKAVSVATEIKYELCLHPLSRY